jgi:hypothetical protein
MSQRGPFPSPRHVVDYLLNKLESLAYPLSPKFHLRTLSALDCHGYLQLAGSHNSTESTRVIEDLLHLDQTLGSASECGSLGVNILRHFTCQRGKISSKKEENAGWSNCLADSKAGNRF